MILLHFLFGSPNMFGNSDQFHPFPTFGTKPVTGVYETPGQSQGLTPLTKNVSFFPNVTEVLQSWEN